MHNISNTDPTAGLMAAGCLIWAVAAVFILAITVFMIWCWWRICTKAGYSGAMSLLLLIPGIGSIILICILAFGDWPIHKNR